MKLAAFLFLASSVVGFSQGIFVYKSQNFHDDSAAHAFVYLTVLEQDPIVWVTTDKDRVRFEMNQFHQWIPLRRTLPSQLVTNDEIRNFRSEVTATTKFYNRFTQAQPLMKDSMNSLNQVIQKLDEGRLLYHDRWISNIDYTAIQEKLRLDALSLQIERQRIESAKTATEQKIVTAAADQLKKTAEAARQKRELVREQRLSEVEKNILTVKSEIRNVEDRQHIFIEKLNQLISE